MSTSLKAAALAALVVLTLAAPASAARVHTADETGDVYSKDAEGAWSSVGTRTNVDVVSSAVRHGDSRVRGAVTYDDLVEDDDRIVVPVRLHVSTGETFLMRVVAGSEDRDGTATLLRYTGTGADVERVACQGMDHSVSYADERVVVSAPRACLGRPTWVRYGGTVRTVDSEGLTFTDALLSADPVNDLYSERIRRG